MAYLQDRKFVVNGQPVLVLSAEVHYFRLSKAEWHDRITKARQAGCNAIASYIPWMFHEESEGQIDLSGSRRAEHDLGAFIDICHSEGLWFIPRPGPFVMGEVKNEGIPDWIYRLCPDAVPITWGGKRVSSKTLSYLNPSFLKYVKRWYDALGVVLTPRMVHLGGNIIAMQLDNEIGMLQCWTEEADLSDDVLCEFAEWVQAKRSHQEILAHYKFDLGDPFARSKILREGSSSSSLPFHTDYTEFTRDRFARYVLKLKEFAENAGVKDVPFLVNIHGSGGGRATTFPIGISQTFRAYTQDKCFWGASDFYLGELTRSNVQDLYFLNAFMACVNRPEQPVASMEFEAGTGDYGENGAVRQTGSATDFKARLCVIQGNRLLNHYILAGGRNPMLDHPKMDGNGRLGTTGERHGFAAPISPEGHLDPTYFALKETNETLNAVAPLLVDMAEDHDSVALGFVPDYYSTDVKPVGPMRDLATKLESARGFLESLTRSMLACGLSFPAVNLQAKIPSSTKTIALATSPCLSNAVQASLLDFVHKGGNLILYGDVPHEDLEGNPATLLVDGLKITLHAPVLGTSDLFPSLQGVGWAHLEPEVRVYRAPSFTPAAGQTFLRLAQSDRSVGAVITFGEGKVVVITAELPFHISLWNGILNLVNVRPEVTHNAPQGGVILSRLRNSAGGRFISLINLDQENKKLNLIEGGREIFEQPVFLPGYKAKWLPLNLTLSRMNVVSSTAEISGANKNTLWFRQTQVLEHIVINGDIKHSDKDVSLTKRVGKLSYLEIAPGESKVWFRSG